MSASVKVWTSDRLSRSDDGKASGFDCVMMVFADVSGYASQVMSMVCE